MPFTKENAKFYGDKGKAKRYGKDFPETDEVPIKKKVKLKKSGDSKLQDAHAARERDFTKDEAPRTEDLIDQLEDAGERKRAEGRPAEEVAATEDAYKQLVISMTQLRKDHEALLQRLGTVESVSRNRIYTAMLKCGTCHQDLYDPAAKKGVCKGVHVVVRVAPQMNEFWADFPGVNWNGVVYAGYMKLPVEIASDVVAQVGQWESRERKKYIPGGKNFGTRDVTELRSNRFPVI